LQEQIRSCRRKMIQAQVRAEIAQDMLDESGESGATSWEDIQEQPLKRVSTGITSLDRICGVTREYVCKETGNTYPETWGPVIGKIYILAAEKGMGKTRLMTKLMATMCSEEGYFPDTMQPYGGLRGVYFQAESTKVDFISTFVQGVWKKGSTKVSISGDTLLSEHERIVREVSPQVVVIDSKDMLHEFQTAALLESAIASYRRWAAELGFIVFIISHVNKAGELKGNTRFGHAVDAIILGCRSEHDSDVFSLYFDKNRMGRIGQEIYFRHTETTIEEYDSSEIKTKLNPGLALLLDDIDPETDDIIDVIPDT